MALSAKKQTQVVRVPDLTRLMNLVTSVQEKNIKFGDGYKLAQHPVLLDVLNWKNMDPRQKDEALAQSELARAVFAAYAERDYKKRALAISKLNSYIKTLEDVHIAKVLARRAENLAHQHGVQGHVPFGEIHLPVDNRVSSVVREEKASVDIDQYGRIRNRNYRPESEDSAAKSAKQNKKTSKVDETSHIRREEGPQKKSQKKSQPKNPGNERYEYDIKKRVVRRILVIPNKGGPGETRRITEYWLNRKERWHYNELVDANGKIEIERPDEAKLKYFGTEFRKCSVKTEAGNMDCYARVSHVSTDADKAEFEKYTKMLDAYEQGQNNKVTKRKKTDPQTKRKRGQSKTRKPAASYKIINSNILRRTIRVREGVYEVMLIDFQHNTAEVYEANRSGNVLKKIDRTTKTVSDFFADTSKVEFNRYLEVYQRLMQKETLITEEKTVVQQVTGEQNGNSKDGQAANAKKQPQPGKHVISEKVDGDLIRRVEKNSDGSYQMSVVNIKEGKIGIYYGSLDAKKQFVWDRHNAEFKKLTENQLQFYKQLHTKLQHPTQRPAQNIQKVNVSKMKVEWKFDEKYQIVTKIEIVQTDDGFHRTVREFHVDPDEVYRNGDAPARYQKSFTHVELLDAKGNVKKEVLPNARREGRYPTSVEGIDYDNNGHKAVVGWLSAREVATYQRMYENRDHYTASRYNPNTTLIHIPRKPTVDVPPNPPVPPTPPVPPVPPTPPVNPEPNKGEKGEKGDPGKDGHDGKDGETKVIVKHVYEKLPKESWWKKVLRYIGLGGLIGMVGLKGCNSDPVNVDEKAREAFAAAHQTRTEQTVAVKTPQQRSVQLNVTFVKLNNNDAEKKEAVQAPEKVQKTVKKIQTAKPKKVQNEQRQKLTPRVSAKTVEKSSDVAVLSNGIKISKDTMICLKPWWSPDKPVYVKVGDLCGGDLQKLPEMVRYLDSIRGSDLALKGNEWHSDKKIMQIKKNGKVVGEVPYTQEQQKGAVNLDLFRVTQQNGTVSYRPIKLPGADSRNL